MSTMLGATLYEIVVPAASNQISVNYPLSNRFSVIELIFFLACGHGKGKIFRLDWESWQVFLSTSKDRLIWPLGILLLSPNPCQFPSGSQRDFGLWAFFFFLQILSFWSWKILFPTTNASKFPSGILRRFWSPGISFPLTIPARFLPRFWPPGILFPAAN